MSTTDNVDFAWRSGSNTVQTATTDNPSHYQELRVLKDDNAYQTLQQQWKYNVSVLRQCIMKSANFNITNMQKVLSVSMSCLKLYKEHEANGPHQFVVSFYISFFSFQISMFQIEPSLVWSQYLSKVFIQKNRSTLSKNASIIIVALYS